MSSRYVELPNGSYLEWPEGVSAATFKAKATKLGLAPKESESPNRVNESMGKITGISAYHPKTGLAGIEEKMGDWRQQLSEFANRGSGSFKVGNTSEIGDFMASGPLGVMRTAKGVSEVPQGKLWKGTKDIVGGGMEAMTIPGLMVAPEAAGAAGNMLPSTEKAGSLLQAVEKVAGHVELPHLNRPLAEAVRIRDMAKSGATMPKVVRNFLERASKPEPLTYSEARKFYENATRVSFDEANRLTPKAKYMLGKFTKALDTSIHEAAASVGQGDAYAKAMKAYHSAARFRDFTTRVKTKAIPAAAKGAAYTAGAGAGYKLMEMLIGAPHGR